MDTDARRKRVTASQLLKAQQGYEAAMARTEAARVKRDATVRQALAEGKTQTWVGEAMGLSQGRIGQIVNRSAGAGR